MGGAEGREARGGARSLTLDVFPGVYPPAEDTFLLADVVEDLGRVGFLRGKRFLDMGCGTGYIGIEAARWGAHVFFADVNPEAVRNALHNAGKNGISAEGVVSDLFENVRGVFDVIAFNPPYVPVEGEDPSWSGGKGGVDVVLRFVRDVPNHLSPDGFFLLLLSSLGDYRRVLQEMESQGFCVRVLARRRLFFEELFVVEGRPCR